MCRVASRSNPNRYIQSATISGISYKSMKYKNDFNKYILKKVTTTDNLSGLRCLHFLSIVTIFEIISFAFVANYLPMRKHILLLSKTLKEKKQIDCPLLLNLESLGNGLFQDCFVVDTANQVDYRKRKFQKKYGFNYFINIVVRSCNAQDVTIEKPQEVPVSGQNKKRKVDVRVEEDTEWAEVNTYNIFNSKVCVLRGTKITIISRTNISSNLFQLTELYGQMYRERSEVRIQLEVCVCKM